MTYLITLQDLYNKTTIQSNVQSSLLYPFIEKAQEMNALKLLGTAQYDELISQVNIYGLNNVTGTTLALLNQIQPMIINWTWYYATPFLAVKFDNKGVNYLNSDNSDPVSESKITNLLGKIQQFAEESELKALKFLRKYYQNYPLWRENIYYEEDCYIQNGQTLFGGIQFDNYYGEKRIYINGKWYNQSDLL